MFTSFASRCACATLLAATLLAGCTDELKYRKGDPANGSIGFNARLMSGWVNTRAEQCDRPYVSDVKGGEAIADSLFLNMTTTPGVMTGTYDLRHAEGLEYDTDRKGEGIVTRATPITPDNGEMYTDFGVSAYSYQGDWNEATATPDFFYNLKASRQTNGIYNLSDSYFWPAQGYNMRFFAMAPYNNAYFTMSDASKKGSPTITVDIPGNVGYQKDLLVATSGEMTNRPNENVDLNFQHPLTAIRFVVGDDMAAGVVQKINIHNVFYHGELNLANNQWTVGDKKRTFYQTLGVTAEDKGDGNAIQETELTNASQTFMMMPQTLPDDAMISMELTAGGKLYTISASIAGQVWKPGTTVTYEISTTSINWTYTFTATNTQPDASLHGTFQVASYRTHLTGRKEAVPIEAEYAFENIRRWSPLPPSCVLSVDPMRTSLQDEKYNIQLEAITTALNDAQQLKDNEPLGTDAAPYNLSNDKGEATIENTANCYVINAAGKYRIPLVYGNAIKNGMPNPSSYTCDLPDITGNGILNKFVNHLTADITDPFIYKNKNCTPGGCKLEYQTVNGMIKNIQLDEKKEFIEFEVDQANIAPGNAVISVIDIPGQTMWSWHLWVTAHNTNSTVPITTSETERVHSLMSRYLGQTGYNGNDPQVLVRLSNGVKKKILGFSIPAPKEKINPTGPLFIWGRKDPVGFVSKATIGTTTLMSGYDINGTSVATANDKMMSAAKSYLALSIQYPTYTGNGYSGYLNQWDNGLNRQTHLTTKVGRVTTKIKTIYDPSPVGFCVISESALSEFAECVVNYPDKWGQINTFKNGIKFWSLELGFLRYGGRIAPSYGTGTYLICNTKYNDRSVYELHGGQFYGTSKMTHYTRSMSVCHAVYCQAEEEEL